jgi:hypothetical protein
MPPHLAIVIVGRNPLYPTAMLTLESVFVTDAFPKHTYVAAEEGRIEKLFQDGLDIANKIVSIVGPSKCGKTTLCDKKFGVESGSYKLSATGDAFDNADQFWFILYQQVKKGQTSDELAYVSRDQMVNAVVESGLPVIIDDFHYIDSEIQKRLCQQMKNAAAKGVRFIVLNPPQRGDDPIRNNPDLSGRFYSVDVNFWDKRGLREIGTKGFQKLKVKVDERIIDNLAVECLGSPQLMQTLCLELGREYLDLDLALESQSIEWSQFDWSSIRQRAVRSYDHTTTYERVKNGPKRHGQARKIYRFSNGQEGDVYDVITYALASDPPFLSIPLDELKKRSTGFLKGKKHPNYIAALEQINDLFEGGHMPINWDEGKRTIHILDPHFYFFLRTKVAES